VTDTFSYNGFKELSSYTAKISAASVFSTQFTRDKLGRITQKIETINGTSHTYDYSYDLAGRLTQVNRDGTVSASYTYDSNGNRLTGPKASNVAIYDDQDRLLSYSGSIYAYTANGELNTKTKGAATTNYQYDVLGNLKQVTLPNGIHIDYLIDGHNRRVGKKINGVLKQGFLYQSQLQPIAELDGANNIVSRFVYGAKINVPEYMIKGGITYRIITDHLGSPHLVINITNGSIAQRMDFDEFGRVTADTAPGFQPFGYAGGLYDRDTKLVRFGSRDYDAEAGRWTAKDSIGFSGGDTNLYGYVVGDPINRIDPSGFQQVQPKEIFPPGTVCRTDYEFDPKDVAVTLGVCAACVAEAATAMRKIGGRGPFFGSLGGNFCQTCLFRDPYSKKKRVCTSPEPPDQCFEPNAPLVCIPQICEEPPALNHTPAAPTHSGG